MGNTGKICVPPNTGRLMALKIIRHAIGVKQVDILGTTLSTRSLVALIIVTRRETFEGLFRKFRIKLGFGMTGISHRAREDEFEVTDSE